MKKPVAVLLILSLLANIALAFIVVRTNAFSTLARGSQKTAATQTRATSRPATDDAIIAAVKTGDTKALLDLLKKAGLSDKSARFMNAGLEIQKFADQMLALHPDGPYWRNNRPTAAERLKQQQLSLAAVGRLQNLLADAFPQIASNRYSYLTPERRAQLLALEKDYNDLANETLATSSGFQLQGDTDQIKAIAAERKREIDSFLTPDEIAARDMRESPAAVLLRNDYGAVIDTEAEYQTAYNLMQSAGDDPDAQAAARSQIESMLGSDRMARLAQMNDLDYNLIQSAAARLNLPADTTTASLMNIRNQAQQASADIAADTTLTPAQRAAALQDLAAKSQDQMTGVLGSEGAAAFAKSSSWMNALNKGASFSYDAKGKFRSKK